MVWFYRDKKKKTEKTGRIDPPIIYDLGDTHAG